MVETLFENNYGMNPIDAMNFIEKFVNKELVGFKMKNKYHDNSGYWGLCYCNESGIDFSISSGRGYLEYSLIINEKEINIMQYNENLIYISASSEKNIKYHIDIKKYLILH